MIQTFLLVCKPIPCKNWGGCLFFCYAAYKWLKQNGYPLDSFQIVQYSRDSDDIIQNTGFINGENSPTSSSHFSFFYDGIEYDGEGKIDKARWHKMYQREVLNGLNGRLDLIEHFCVTLLNDCGWNSDFNRGDAIEFLKEVFNLDLSEVG